ncbi:hypothetical protein F4604DRAFT_1743175 [Suillus subluteus]|nr:hypothetical protein F4604DRAFT_1743175 [Suillus subluteus]
MVKVVPIPQEGDREVVQEETRPESPSLSCLNADATRGDGIIEDRQEDLYDNFSPAKLMQRVLVTVILILTLSLLPRHLLNRHHLIPISPPVPSSPLLEHHLSTPPVAGRPLHSTRTSHAQLLYSSCSLGLTRGACNHHTQPTNQCKKRRSRS